MCRKKVVFSTSAVVVLFLKRRHFLRALIDELGKTPERLRDLSVSMNKLGDVAQALLVIG